MVGDINTIHLSNILYCFNGFCRWVGGVKVFSPNLKRGWGETFIFRTNLYLLRYHWKDLLVIKMMTVTLRKDFYNISGQNGRLWLSKLIFCLNLTLDTCHFGRDSSLHHRLLAYIKYKVLYLHLSIAPSVFFYPAA